MVAHQLDDVMLRRLHPGQPLGLGEEVVLDAPGARSLVHVVVIVVDGAAACRVVGDAGTTTTTTNNNNNNNNNSSSGSLPLPDGPDVVLDVLLEVGVLVLVVVQLGALQDRQAVQRWDGQEPHVFVKAYRR